MVDVIGKTVRKYSKKPFKSRLSTATVKSIVDSPYTGKPAYTFTEDDSIVEIRMCKIIDEA